MSSGHIDIVGAVLATMLAKIALDVLKPWPMKVLVDHALGDVPMPPALMAMVNLLPGTTTRQGLAAWSGAADAWFLDGFAPALNPAMWSDELMRLVAARSRPGARRASRGVG